MNRETVLATEGLTKRFGGLLALHHVDVKINRGEIVGLIGPNGSGKTTLFNCVSGFYKPEEGKVFLKGEEITSLQAHQIARKGVSRTFQLAKLFSNLTVLENVMIAKHLMNRTGFLGSLLKSRNYRESESKAAQEAERLLNLVDLADKKKSVAKDLPYGSQRLLTLAIALSFDPELILLDEPTSGMNHEEAEKLVGILRKINEKGGTIFLVEHNMRFVMKLSQRIIALNYGEVICDGEPQVVCKDEAVCAAYLGGAL
jgi:branched-chain amino acid transport system ATP-binding protein